MYKILSPNASDGDKIPCPSYFRSDRVFSCIQLLPMLKRRSSLLILFLALGGCGDSAVSGPPVSGIPIPKANSTFIYDWEQTITPVKPEDVAETYRLEMTAKVTRDGRRAGEFENCIDVNMYDVNGIDVGTMMYRLAIDGYGDVNYIQPQFTNKWVRLPFMSKAEQLGPDTTFGSPTEFYREVRQLSTYLGSEKITVGEEVMDCDKVQWEKWVNERDPYTNGKGSSYEKWTFWYSRELGFFVQRESVIDNKKMHSVPWKYTTREKLKSYSIVK